MHPTTSFTPNYGKKAYLITEHRPQRALSVDLFVIKSNNLNILSASGTLLKNIFFNKIKNGESKYCKGFHGRSQFRLNIYGLFFFWGKADPKFF